MAKAALARVEDDLAKTTISAPIDGTVTKLRVERGERVVGTAMMAGTEIMTIAKLDEMEARAEFSEVDIVLIQLGQKARLEVDAFRNEKFSGSVTEIANAAKTSAAGSQQEATKFEVKIRIQEKSGFRPGMSVTAEIETRYRTNVLTVPIQSVTTRLPKGSADPAKKPKSTRDNPGEPEKKNTDAPKSEEVVFAIEDGKAKRIKVERGIADNNYYEIISGVTEGQEIVSGDYRAINRELEDGKKVKVENEKKSANENR
jgi:HlyD family secretion protein